MINATQPFKTVVTCPVWLFLKSEKLTLMMLSGLSQLGFSDNILSNRKRSLLTKLRLLGGFGDEIQ